VVRRRVPRRGDRLQLRVPEFNDLAIAERGVVEVDAGSLGQVGRRTGALDELGEP
jgi:hypothetical protein